MPTHGKQRLSEPPSSTHTALCSPLMHTAIRKRPYAHGCTRLYAHGHTHMAIRTRLYAHGHMHTAIRTRPYAHGHTHTRLACARAIAALLACTMLCGCPHSFICLSRAALPRRGRRAIRPRHRALTPCPRRCRRSAASPRARSTTAPIFSSTARRLTWQLTLARRVGECSAGERVCPYEPPRRQRAVRERQVRERRVRERAI